MARFHPSWLVLAFSAFLVILFAIAGIRGIKDPVSSALQDDYGALSASHGLAVDINFGGARGKVATGPRTTHPGIIFQAASWVAYRLVTVGNENAYSRASAFFDRAESFFRLSVIISILLTLGGLFVWWRFARHLGCGILPFITAMAYPFCLGEMWRYTTGTMGNESFALPLAALFALCVRKLTLSRLSEEGPHPESGKWAHIDWKQITLYISFGFLTSVIILLKLNYIVWFAAIPAGLIALALTKSAPRGAARKCLIGFLFVVPPTLLFTYLQSLLFIGNEGFLEMLGRHTGIFMHSGYYGQGEAEIVSWATVMTNARDFFAKSGHILVLPALVLLGAICRRWRKLSAKCDTTSGLIALLIGVSLFGFGLDLLAAMKHYFPHYLIAGMVILAIYLLIETNRWSRPAQVAITLASILTCFHGWRTYQHGFATATTVMAEVNAASQLTSTTGDQGFSIYSYGVRHPLGEMAWAVRMSNSVDAARAWRDSQFGRNLHCMGWTLDEKIHWGRERLTIEDLPWNYVWVSDSFESNRDTRLKRQDENETKDEFKSLGLRAEYFAGKVVRSHKVGPYRVLERDPKDFEKALSEQSE